MGAGAGDGQLKVPLRDALAVGTDEFDTAGRYEVPVAGIVELGAQGGALGGEQMAGVAQLELWGDGAGHGDVDRDGLAHDLVDPQPLGILGAVCVVLDDQGGDVLAGYGVVGYGHGHGVA